MAPTILKITPSVNPAIAKGNNRIQKTIKRTRRTSAIGQHTGKRRHNMMNASINFIYMAVY